MKKFKNIAVLLFLVVMAGCSNLKDKEDIVTPLAVEEDIIIKPEEPVIQMPGEESEMEEIEIQEVVEEEEVIIEPVAPVIPPKPPENPKKEIVIVATADLHGRIFPYKYKEFDREDVGGFAKVSTFVKEMRKEYPDLILIDAGDTYFYEPFINSNSPSIIPIMNYLNYDMIVMGNHELYMKSSYLIEELSKFDGYAIVNNVSLSKNGQEEILPNYAKFEVDGVRIAFTGSSIPQMGIRKFLLSYEYNIADPLPETKKTVAELEGQYDLLVGAFHLNKYGQNGSSGVVEVMEDVPEFHFAFNGHEHVDEGDWMAKGKHIIANNAYGITAAYAKVQMEQVEGEWKVISVEPHIVPLEDYQADPDFMSKFLDLHNETKDYVDSGFQNWEKVYHKLHQYIIP